MTHPVQGVSFTLLKDLPLSQADREAGVISDRIGRLEGSPSNQPPGTMVRETNLIDPQNPDRPVRLLSSLLDVPAQVLGTVYRRRWKIELFFRWLKVHAHFEHLISHSPNGARTGCWPMVGCTNGRDGLS